jgi:hypothetical protein
MSIFVSFTLLSEEGSTTMLGKLIKLDFRMMRSHLKWTIPIYALLLTSAFVFRSFNFPVLGQLMYVLAIIATLVLVPVVLVLFLSHYYRHFYTNQGYLTHTLPVTASQRYHSKLISGFLLYVLSSLVAFIGFFCILLAGGLSKGKAMLEINEFLQFMKAWPAFVGVSVFAGVLLIIGIWLLMYVSFFTTMSFSVTVGMGRRFSRFGVGGPFLVYIILYVANQVLGVLGLLFIPLSLRFSSGDLFPQIRVVMEMPIHNLLEIGITGRNLPMEEMIERGGGHFDFGLGVFVFTLAFIVFSYFYTKRQVGKVNLR